MVHSRGGYVGGCRCEVCTEAHRTYMRAYSKGKGLGYKARDCVQCGVSFGSKSAVARFCSRKCYGDSMSKGVRRRAIGKATRRRVHERDDWTCHICGDPVNRRAIVPELDAPTIDHVLALANGGAHDEANFATAHFYCNSVKRDTLLAEVA